MRAAVLRFLRVASALFALWASVFSLSARSDGAASAQPDAQDSFSCREVVSPSLTPNGKWLLYISAPCPGTGGESIVVRRGVESDTESRYSAGDVVSGAGGLKLSPSGRWAAFQVARKVEGDAQPRKALAILNIESGEQATHEGVEEWEFMADPHDSAGTERLLFPADEELIVESLDASERKTLATGASSRSVSPTQSRVVWADPEGLWVYDLRTGAVRSLDADSGAEYREITWSRTGNALAFIKANGAQRALVVFGNALRGPARKLEPRDWKGFPEGHVLAGPLRWRDDGQGLFFNIERKTLPQPAVSGRANLRIWHWKDDHLPGWRRFQASTTSDWCFVDLQSKVFSRLSDPGLAAVEPQGKGQYIVGYDVEKYGWFNKGEMRVGSAIRQLRDYYRVDVRSGQRESIISRLKVWMRTGVAIQPTVSPDGKFFVYEDGTGNLIAHDLATRKQRNLTGSLPSKFYFPENHPAADLRIRDSHGQGEPRIQGWSTDGRYVLVSDHHDIWALSLRGGESINLTGKGREENKWYRIARFDPSVSPWEALQVDLNEPIYLQSFDLETARQGLVRRTPGRVGLESLYAADARLEFIKARDADVYLLARETSTEIADYFRLNASWSPEGRLTNVNPLQPGEVRSAGALYLTYAAPAGERHAALHLPAGYVAGKSYPTIVMIYKGQGAGVHSFRVPQDEMSQYLRNGYAVLMPDILPQLDNAGQAALTDVVAGVDAATATGVVDRDRLALAGHSFGAYETSYIITQTDLFKAAVAFAGMTDLISWHGAVYAGRWPAAQGDQPYLSAPWWNAWDAYIRNSPLFHATDIETPLLLVHGDRDGAVEIGQSVELFNTLRQMGDKPVVLLEYKGVAHTFEEPADYRDFQLRSRRFFDHFLKGAPAPDWWAQGLSRYEGVAAPN